MSRLRKFFVCFLMFVLFLSTAGVAWAQEWPEKEVEIIIPWEAGGATDVLYRAVLSIFPNMLNGKQLII